MTDLPALTKQQALQHMLHTHASVYVHLDSRRAGLQLPAALMGQPALVLQLGYKIRVPTDDLTCDAEGWSATLSFNRVPFFCVVPWSAVYVIVNDSMAGYQWDNDTPPEVVEQQKAAMAKAAAKSAGAKKKVALPKGWGVIEGGKKDDAAGGGQAS